MRKIASATQLADARMGEPKRPIAVLVDRGGRELPFAARFVGTSVDTVPRDTTLVLQRDAAGAPGRFTFGTEASGA